MHLGERRSEHSPRVAPRGRRAPCACGPRWAGTVLCLTVAARATPARAQYDEELAHHARPWGGVSLGGATGGGGRQCGSAEVECFPVNPVPASVAAGIRFPVARVGRLGAAWAGVGAEATSFLLPFSSDPKPSGWLVLGRAGLTGLPALSAEGGAGRFTYSYTSGRLWRVGARLSYGPGFAFVSLIRMNGVSPALTTTERPTPFRPRLAVFGAGLGV